MCWICDKPTLSEGYHRLHRAAAKGHSVLVEELRKQREGTFKTGRTAKLVLNGDDVYLYYREQRGGSRWYHVATLMADCVVVKFDQTHRQGVRQRITDVLAHRGGSARFFSFRKRVMIYYKSADLKVAEALAKGSGNELTWRDMWYACRWVPVQNIVTFYAGRDPEGAKPWRKHCRRPHA